MSGQLESAAQSIQDAIDAIEDKTSQVFLEFEKIQEELRDLMLGDRGLGGNSRDSIVLAEIARDIKSLVSMGMAQRAEGVDTPRYCCVLPPWPFEDEEEGLSPAEQNPLTWMHRLREWQLGSRREGKGFFTKETRLFLVCARTYRLVPCGPKGQGYVIRQLRKRVAGVGSVMSVMLRIAFATLGAVALADIASSVVEGALEEALDLAKDGAVSELQKQLDRVALGEAAATLNQRGGASPLQAVRILNEGRHHCLGRHKRRDEVLGATLAGIAS